MSNTVFAGRENAFASMTDAGLTKREFIAALIFAAMHGAPDERRADERYAVIQADRLLEQLNKEEA